MTEDKAELRETLTLEELIPEITHKLNNRLTSVKGYAQLLMFTMIEPAAKKNLEKIIREVNEASQIIDDLMSIVRERKNLKQK